jgi:hypothetical protein
MGNTAVALLNYDHLSKISDQSPSLARAMRNFASNKQHSDVNFDFGSIISFDHSSGIQVCIVGHGTGWRIGVGCPVPDYVMTSVATALNRDGYVHKKNRGPIVNDVLVREALFAARSQLVTLGGNGEGDFGDTIQRKILSQIDEALNLTL